MSGDESGISVYPRLPVPSNRNEPQPPPIPPPLRPAQRKAVDRRLIIMIAAAGLAGGTAAWFLQPAIAPDTRIATAMRRASEAEQVAAAQKDRASSLENSLDTTARGKRDVEAKLAVAEAAQAELASRVASEAGQRKATEAVQSMLKAAVDRVDTVTIEDGEVHIRIADRGLWKPNDDALTDRGKLVLTRLAAALKELPDQQIWVQGHTDDQPVALPKPPPAPPPPVKKPGGKPVKPGAVVAPPGPPVRFPTNWELSAARALSVVRFLQDTAKVEPTRLAALAFGPYAPISKKDRAANRRLEIVIMPRRPPAK